jgi:adenylyl-sulfate kinase
MPTNKVLWFTGLSGAGKSTIAQNLSHKLSEATINSIILDGDELRLGLNKDLGFTSEDRIENVRRTAEVAKILFKNGVNVIVALITPTYQLREIAREIIGEDSFTEVFINTPIDICELRDVKGLYKKARSGNLKNFTGIDAPYDIPLNPDIEVDTTLLSVDDAVALIIKKVKPLIF